MRAAEEGHASVVALLLADKRVDPNMTDQDGFTALMHSAEEGHASVVELLLADKRVDPKMTNQKGDTAVQLAGSKGYVGVVKLLKPTKKKEPEPIKLQSDAILKQLNTLANERIDELEKQNMGLKEELERQKRVHTAQMVAATKNARDHFSEDRARYEAQIAEAALKGSIYEARVAQDAAKIKKLSEEVDTLSASAGKLKAANEKIEELGPKAQQLFDIKKDIASLQTQNEKVGAPAPLMYYRILYLIPVSDFSHYPITTLFK